MTNPRCLLENNASHYCRFRDDLFWIEHGEDSQFHRELIAKASPMYSVPIEQRSGVEVDMLDVTVVKGARRLHYKPFFKPTAQKCPLHHDSCHPKSVHDSWPVAESEDRQGKFVTR